MDPTAAADPSAATSKSALNANLASLFRDVMRLGEPEREQRQRHAAQGPPPPSRGQQQQDQRYAAVYAEMVSSSPALQVTMRTMSKMMQDLQATRQFWPNPQPCYSYASPAGSSGSAGYASQIGAGVAAGNAFGSPAQSGTQHQSGPSSSAPQPLSASASQYQPEPAAAPAPMTVSQYQYHYQQEAVAAPLTLSQYQYQPEPAAAPLPQYQYQYQPEPAGAPMTVGQYHYQPEPAAAPLPLSQYQYQPKPAAAPLTSSQYQPYAIVPHQPGDASPAPDYGSSFHERMRAIQAAQAQAMPSRARRCRTLEETRSALLGGAPMELQLVTFPDSAAHVVHLLLCKDAEGHERILQSVLAGVTRRVHVFIENKEGYEVLVALLRACAGRHAEVDAIVRAAVAPAGPGRNSLLRSPRHDYWETSVMELMTAASPYPELGAMLVDKLLSEGMLTHERGDQLLQHCFATTRHQDAVVVLQCALDNIDAMLLSPSGSASKCLVECYDRASGHQLRAFNDVLLAGASTIATGKFSNYFMQHVLERGDGETARLLVERLMADVLDLSLHSIGSYVVEACYQRAELLPCVLAAFLRLDDACLVQLVQGPHSNYVVHKLLDTAINAFPRETLALARRIDGLPQEVYNCKFSKKVMKVVWKIFTRYGRMYG